MRLLILLPLLLIACSHSTTAMTRDRFDSIALGTPASEIGEPYDIKKKPGGVEEYKYIEKIRDERLPVLEIHYTITISNGKVISKKVDYKQRPAYDLIYEEDPNFASY